MKESEFFNVEAFPGRDSAEPVHCINILKLQGDQWEQFLLQGGRIENAPPQIYTYTLKSLRTCSLSWLDASQCLVSIQPERM